MGHLPPKRTTRTGTATLRAVSRSIQGEQHAGIITDAGQKWLSTELDDDMLACHTWGHEWGSMADLLKGKKAKNLELVPDQFRVGVYQVRQHCKRGCGVTRWFETLPGGYWNTNTETGGGRWQYEYRDPRYHQPAHSNASKADKKEEFGRRLHDVIEARSTAPTAVFSG